MAKCSWRRACVRSRCIALLLGCGGIGFGALRGQRAFLCDCARNAIAADADGSVTITMSRPVTVWTEVGLFEQRLDLKRDKEALAGWRCDYKSEIAAIKRSNGKNFAAGGPEMLAAAIEWRRRERYARRSLPPPDQIMEALPEMRG
jgi:hypothetical protein